MDRLAQVPAQPRDRSVSEPGISGPESSEVRRANSRAKGRTKSLTSAMFSPVDTRSPAAVERAVSAAYREMFPQGNSRFVAEVFQWAVDCFEGRYSEYQAIDARYHDLEHTLQGALCMARLLAGRQRAGQEPILSQRQVELGLVGILLHDTGYLKVRGDREGTGAKYTLTHVNRSCEFAARLLGERQFRADEIAAVQQMIRCTGVNVELAAIPFASDEVRLAGFALGTADLLGQMAAADYIEKLPVLYLEFEESARFNANRSSAVCLFDSAEELRRKTPAFWEQYVVPKLERDFLGLHRFLNDPWPDGPNWYLQHVVENIDRLKRQIA